MSCDSKLLPPQESLRLPPQDNSLGADLPKAYLRPRRVRCLARRIALVSKLPAVAAVDRLAEGSSRVLGGAVGPLMVNASASGSRRPGIAAATASSAN